MSRVPSISVDAPPGPDFATSGSRISRSAVSPGTLYSVAVPIGDPQDITLRAIQVLSSVDLIAAEDTRVFRDLVREARLSPRAHKIVSYHGHNEEGRTRYLIERLRSADSVALVSDAGTPGINDPGNVVIRAAIEADLPVVCVPGACAAVAALSISGLRTDRFHYFGFLPRRTGRRNRVLDAVADLPGTLVFYEAPHRILETLRALAHKLGDRRAEVLRNLTKPTQTLSRGRLLALGDEWDRDEKARGEFTILVEGAESAPPALTPDVEALIERWVGRGADPSMVRELTQELLHIRRGSLYDRVLDARRAV